MQGEKKWPCVLPFDLPPRNYTNETHASVNTIGLGPFPFFLECMIPTLILVWLPFLGEITHQ